MIARINARDRCDRRGEAGWLQDGDERMDGVLQ